jgi:poly(hydroxyalkanoate) depolymerase family esterase
MDTSPPERFQRTVASARSGARRVDTGGETEPGASSPPTATGRMHAHTYTGPSGSRDYRLYVPGRRRPGPVGLVVMLHGGTQNPEDFATGTRMNEHADRDGFLVAYPEQPRRASLARFWNWQRPQNQHRDSGEPALIAGITREVMDAHQVEPGSVFVAGLSSGGAMALILATTYPDLYTAAGVHSGVPYASASGTVSAIRTVRNHTAADHPELAQSCPIIVFHGGQDRAVREANADEVVIQAARALNGVAEPAHLVPAAGSSVEAGYAHSRTDYRDPQGHLVVQDWRILEAGHAWSGGSPEGSFTHPEGPDATAAMLRFFAQVHSRVQR